ncbi:MAG: hypothetical protein Q4A62_04135 [Eikenella sp.]|nr:hypothetical protein [Eikenella sp.]
MAYLTFSQRFIGRTMTKRFCVLGAVSVLLSGCLGYDPVTLVEKGWLRRTFVGQHISVVQNHNKFRQYRYSAADNRYVYHFVSEPMYQGKTVSHGWRGNTHYYSKVCAVQHTYYLFDTNPGGYVTNVDMQFRVTEEYC